MNMYPIHAILLAAGMSSRFGVEFNKLLTPLCGTPLVMHAIRSLEHLQIPITVVVGHRRADVIEVIRKQATSEISFAIQEKQCGTGHAVLCSREYWKTDTILILNGDMPLITSAIIDVLYRRHCADNATVSFVTALPDTQEHAYGRVIQNGMHIEIVEAKDFTGDTTCAYPINAGIYLFNRIFLEQSIDSLTTDNANQELYLTDLIAMASNQEKKVSTLAVPFDLVRGVNTIAEFATAHAVERKKIIEYWMTQGVLFTMPETVHIDTDVTIGRGTIIHAGVQLYGATHIGGYCTLNAYALIKDSTLGDYVTVHSHSLLDTANLSAHAQVGPFAHIHSHTQLAEQVVVGNFVEVKNSSIGAQTKAKHLTYLGDATVGKEVTIGAGTIFCNYDGVHKNRTVIQDNAFIGSNNTLIAPLTIGIGAYTAAGSTITDDVPADALAFGRARQINKLSYASMLRTKQSIPEHMPVNNGVSDVS
jgi:bifunctional UDP-N-acetylglucosamine pyrophosphorylase/glucosamine-1-phosphate N-acetyltransferase